MAKKKLIKNLLNVLENAEDKTSEGFKAFDDGVEKLKAQLREKFESNTIEEVNRLRQKINLEPLTRAIEQIKQELVSRDTELTNSIGNELEALRLKLLKSSLKNNEDFNSTKEKILSLESQLQEVSNRKLPEFPDFTTPIKEAEERLNKVIKGIKDSDKSQELQKLITSLEEELKKSRVELLNRINERGGGSMNRRIRVGGSNVLNKYTDINLVAGAGITLTTSEDNTDKDVDITITSTADLSVTLADVSANSTDATKSLYTMTAGVDVVFENSSNQTMFSLGSAGAIGLTARGTNQNITLTPSGTGTVRVNQITDNVTGGLSIFESTALVGSLRLWVDSGGQARLDGTSSSNGAIVFNGAGAGNLLIGTTSNGTGRIQFATATTAAGGITFGADINAYRSGSQTFTWNASVNGSNFYTFSNLTSGTAAITGIQLRQNNDNSRMLGMYYFSAGYTAAGLFLPAMGYISTPNNSTNGLLIATETTASIRLATNNTLALTINSSQQVSVPATTASTSSSTGALVVSGGVGVGGALHVGTSITSYGGNIVSAQLFANNGVGSSVAGYYGTKGGNGSTQFHEFYANSTATSDVTGTLTGFRSLLGTTAAVYTLTNMNHFSAEDGTKGAGSTITTQTGLNVGALSLGTTVYGIRSQVASGATKYNIYADGTAQNLFAGVTTISNTASSSSTTTGSLINAGGFGNAGKIFAGDNINTATYFIASVGNALTAAGSTRTDALQLAKQVNNVTTAAAGTGVILPVGVIGMRITIFNAGANAIQVYASASETIDTVAGATGVPLTNAKRADFFFTAANTWISAQLGAVSA